jgi:hypothetical protein
MRRIGRVARGVAKLGAIALVTLALLEGALRLCPAAIPLQLLGDFEPDLRAEIARRLALPTRSDQVAIPRDDGGPPLSIDPPNQLIRTYFRDLGMVNEVRMDARGFCNPPSIDPARPEFDIVALGDSFTWCTNVEPEATWAHQLAGATGRSVYNLGRPAIGLYEDIQLLKTFGLQKKPRVVVLNIYEGNDLRDAIVYRDHADKVARGTAHELGMRALSRIDRVFAWMGGGWLARSSYAFNLGLVSAGWAHEEARKALFPHDVVPSGAPDFRYTLRFPAGSVDFNPENYDPDVAVHARAVAEGRIRPHAFDAALDTLAALSRRNDFELLIVYSPSAYSAYAEFVAFNDPALAPIMKQYSDTQRGYFASATAARGIAFLDLTPALQQAARTHGARTLLYYQTTVHYTPAGHKVVAETIAKHFAERPR